MLAGFETSNLGASSINIRDLACFDRLQEVFQHANSHNVPAMGTFATASLRSFGQNACCELEDASFGATADYLNGKGIAYTPRCDDPLQTIAFAHPYGATPS
jgi:hypothetical protein